MKNINHEDFKYLIIFLMRIVLSRHIITRCDYVNNSKVIIFYFVYLYIFIY